MSQSQIGGSSADVVHTLRSLRSEALRLPDESETWASIQYDISRKAIQKFKLASVVECVGFEKVPIDPDDPNVGTYERNVYRTDAGAYAWIQENLTETTECPAEGCHATGVSNPRGVAGYRCNNPDCDEVLTEAQARELIR